jgi:hypothetical protein
MWFPFPTEAEGLLQSHAAPRKRGCLCTQQQCELRRKARAQESQPAALKMQSTQKRKENPGHQPKPAQSQTMAAAAIDFEKVLSQMREVRLSIEEDRNSAIAHVAALEARIKQLEAENASLKGSAPAAARGAASSEPGRIPPGHTSYTWQHGMERYSSGVTSTIPPGHNQYTWSQAMIPAMFDSPIAAALLAPPAPSSSAVAAAASPPAAATPETLMRVDKFQRTPIARLLQSPQKGKEFIGTNVTVCGWSRTVRVQVTAPPLPINICSHGFAGRRPVCVCRAE